MILIFSKFILLIFINSIIYSAKRKYIKLNKKIWIKTIKKFRINKKNKNGISEFKKNLKKFYKRSNEDFEKYTIPNFNIVYWVQRLKWFESKIIAYYKNLNYTSILIIGPEIFLNEFKNSVINQKWNADFTYSLIPKQNLIEKNNFVIDCKYDSKYFLKIYKKVKVSSFISIYKKVLIEETLNFLKSKGVHSLFFGSPLIQRIRKLSKKDLRIRRLRKKIFKLMSEKNKKFLSIAYSDNHESFEFAQGNFVSYFKVINNGKYYIFRDIDKGDILKLSNGLRRTFYNHKESKNIQKIYFYGPCISFGAYTSDKYTIESQLQKLINKREKYSNILNYGMWGTDWRKGLERILTTPLKKSDFVILIVERDLYFINQLKKHKQKFYDTSFLFNRPHHYGYWMIDSPIHINHNGNKAIANYIYKIIKPYLKTSPVYENEVKYKFENEEDTFIEDNPEFKKYLNDLKLFKINTTNKIGAVVMNCNPFTLGHRYLIEESLKYIDHLFIFVVEEDKSIFPFKDRILLVKQGVSDLNNNVTVLPSGKWMISLLTFPEYFDKDALQEDIIDPSKDIALFAKYICPILNITYRFVGEEPFDKVTKQYNDAMRKQLKEYNITFIEIPRKEIKKGEIVSATKVRELIKNINNTEDNIRNLKNYIPNSTLEYLKNKFIENGNNKKKRNIHKRNKLHQEESKIYSMEKFYGLSKQNKN